MTEAATVQMEFAVEDARRLLAAVAPGPRGGVPRFKPKEVADMARRARGIEMTFRRLSWAMERAVEKATGSCLRCPDGRCHGSTMDACDIRREADAAHAAREIAHQDAAHPGT